MTNSNTPVALVYGLAITGLATVRALLRRGYTVVTADDVVTDERRQSAADLGVVLLDAPTSEELERVVATCSLVSPAPGIPETHRLIDVSGELGVELVSEIELAYRWEQERVGGPRPMLAVTGTDGKTTTTLMAVAMLRAAGLSTIDAGNTDTPLVDAIEDDDFDVFVVECASFRLAWTPSFRADAAVWLNLAPDHLNWHRSMESYEDAKFQIWANQRSDDTAIGFATDDNVSSRLGRAPGRRRSFAATEADYSVVEDVLVGPNGPIAEVATMRRSLPHDITNALAASALVLESGLATSADISKALAGFVGPPHRLEHIGRWDGVDWFNDSKATTPHAAAVAIAAFDRVVLIAGGKDKYVDLAEMAVEVHRVDAVIAIGETTDKVVEAFATVEIIERCTTLTEAVGSAASMVVPGQTVLLSPGCASLDQYPSFEARGDEFRALVLSRHDSISTSATPSSLATSATPSSPSTQGRCS